MNAVKFVRIPSQMVFWAHALLLIFFVSGCAESCSIKVCNSVIFGQDRTGTTSAALLELVDRFDDRNPDLDNEGGSDPLSKIELEILGPGSSTPAEITRSRAIGFRRSEGTSFGDGWLAWTAGSIALGNSHYKLPEGIDVFTDPILIKVSSLTLQSELGISRELEVGNTRLFAEVGLGFEVSENYVGVQSAILDIKNRSLISTEYAMTSIILQNSAARGALALEGRLYRNGSALVRTEFRYMNSK
jgi:hypothetical protein